MADSIFDLIFGENRFQPKSVSLIDGLNTLTESAFPVSTGYRKFLDIPAESRANLIQPLREKVEQMPTAPYDVQRGGFQGVLGSSEAEKIDGYSGSDPTDYDISGENISNFDKLMAENILGGAELMVQPDVIGKELSDIGQGYYQKATGDITNKEQVAKAEATTEAVKGLLTPEGFNKSLYESGGALNLVGGGVYGAYKGAQLSKALYDKGIQAGMSVRKIDEPIKTSDTEPRVDPSGYYMQSEDFLINQGKENFKSPQTLASYSKKDPNKIVGLLADKGVPELEIKELGLVDFLAQKQKEGQGVTRSELLDYINENRPYVSKISYEAEKGDKINVATLSSEDPVKAGELFNISGFPEIVPFDVVDEGYSPRLLNQMISDRDIDDYDNWIIDMRRAVDDNPNGDRTDLLNSMIQEYDQPKYRQAIESGNVDAVDPAFRDAFLEGRKAIYENSGWQRWKTEAGYEATYQPLFNEWVIKDNQGNPIDNHDIDFYNEEYNLGIDPYNMTQEDVNMIIRQDMMDREDMGQFGTDKPILKDVYWNQYTSGNIDQSTYFEEPVFVEKKGLRKPTFADFHTMGKGEESVGGDYLFHIRGGEITDQEGVRHLNIQELQSDWWQQLGKYGQDIYESRAKMMNALNQAEKDFAYKPVRDAIDLYKSGFETEKALQDFNIKTSMKNYVDEIKDYPEITQYKQEELNTLKTAVNKLDDIMKPVFDLDSEGTIKRRYNQYGLTPQSFLHHLTKQKIATSGKFTDNEYSLLLKLRSDIEEIQTIMKRDMNSKKASGEKALFDAKKDMSEKGKKRVAELQSKLSQLDKKRTGVGGTRPPLGREKGRKKYAETGLKEAVKKAIDRGIDRVSWTTGDMQVQMGSESGRTAYVNLYDKDLVNYAKEYADKYGGKVGTVDIDFGGFQHPDKHKIMYQGEQKVHYLEITPEMKKNLTKGGDQVKQSLYSASPAVPLGILGMQEEEKGRMNPNKGLLQ